MLPCQMHAQDNLSPHHDGRHEQRHLAELECRMKQRHKANPVSHLLTEVSGMGSVNALSLALTIDPGRFQSGRHFAAWLGLVPKEHSTGGRQRLGGVTRGFVCVSSWNGYGGGIQPGRQRAAAAVAGGNNSDPLRQAREQHRLALAAGLAGAQAVGLAIRLQGSGWRSRSRDSGSGQQDGPHRVGGAGQGSSRVADGMPAEA